MFSLWRWALRQVWPILSLVMAVSSARIEEWVHQWCRVSCLVCPSVVCRSKSVRVVSQCLVQVVRRLVRESVWSVGRSMGVGLE